MEMNVYVVINLLRGQVVNNPHPKGQDEMKKTLLIISLLILSVGFSQQLTKVVETYNNGNIESITSHKETRNRIEKVKYVEYYRNGQKKGEGTYKDGKENGLWTKWYENGQKEFERNYKDGKEDGLWTYWYENGQKESEGNWKDGKLIFKECWDWDGNEEDCN